MRRMLPLVVFAVGVGVGYLALPKVAPGTAADVTDPEWISVIEVCAPGQQPVTLRPNVISVDDTRHHKVASMNGPTWRIHLRGAGKQVSLLAVEPKD